MHKVLFELMFPHELLVDFSGFQPGKQNPKTYTLPARPGRYSFEYRMSNFVIDHDLGAPLNREEITERVALIVDRIGQRARALLSNTE